MFHPRNQDKVAEALNGEWFVSMVLATSKRQNSDNCGRMSPWFLMLSWTNCGAIVTFGLVSSSGNHCNVALQTRGCLSNITVSMSKTVSLLYPCELSPTLRNKPKKPVALQSDNSDKLSQVKLTSSKPKCAAQTASLDWKSPNGHQHKWLWILYWWTAVDPLEPTISLSSSRYNLKIALNDWSSHCDHLVIRTFKLLCLILQLLVNIQLFSLHFLNFITFDLSILLYIGYQTAGWFTLCLRYLRYVLTVVIIRRLACGYFFQLSWPYFVRVFEESGAGETLELLWCACRSRLEEVPEGKPNCCVLLG